MKYCMCFSVYTVLCRSLVGYSPWGCKVRHDLVTKKQQQQCVCVCVCVCVYFCLVAWSYLFVCVSVQFSSVAQSCPTLCDPMNLSTPGLPVHHQLLEFSQTHVHRVSDAIQPSHPSLPPSPPAPQSPPASESFPMSQLFTWGGQSTGASALASFLPKKSQGWSPSEWTDWISLQSKGLSRVFSNTTVQKHQFFCAQPSSQSNSHIHTWPQEKP